MVFEKENSGSSLLFSLPFLSSLPQSRNRLPTPPFIIDSSPGDARIIPSIVSLLFPIEDLALFSTSLPRSFLKIEQNKKKNLQKTFVKKVPLSIFSISKLEVMFCVVIFRKPSSHIASGCPVFFCRGQLFISSSSFPKSSSRTLQKDVDIMCIDKSDCFSMYVYCYFSRCVA